MFVRKTTTILSLLSILALSIPQTSSASVFDYWQYWKQSQNRNTTSISDSVRQRFYNRPSSNRTTSSRYRTYPTKPAQSTSTTTTTPSYTPAPRTTTTSTKGLSIRERLRLKLYGKRTTSTSTTTSNTYTNQSNSGESYLNVSVTPKQLSKAINQVSNATIPLFTVGFSHPRVRNSNTFAEAIQVDEMKFRILDNTGIVRDPEDLALVIDGTSYRFDPSGYLTIDFNNFRLAAGSSQGLDVDIRIDDPNNVPNIDGSFRVRLDSVTAYKESSFNKVPSQVRGQNVSGYIAFQPHVSNSGTGTTIAGTSSTIFGKTLSAGERAPVLGLKFGASFDDLLLREIKVRNTFGNSVDSWVRALHLVNNKTGRTVESTRFINGVATFNLNGQDQIQINRNDQAHLVFEAEMASDIRTNTQNTQFKLEINPSDVEIWGLGSGREVPNSQKLFSFDSETFFVTQAGGSGGFVSSSNQPTLIPTNNLQSVYRFNLVNNGAQEFSLGRLTLGVFPNGVSFTNGTSADFKLIRTINGNIVNSPFTAQYLGNNQVRFDANSEIIIDRNSSAEFTLQVSLNNESGDDALGVQLLGDSTLSKGTFSGLKAGSSNFIWSDHSGFPHTNTSNDWFSGYLFPGLPSNTFVNKR